jgi:hypothetical protein
MEPRVNTQTPGGPANFLARVIERAQGAAELALPRVPGLFEPVAGTAPAVAADTSEGRGEFEREEPERMNTAIDAHERSTREPSRSRLHDDETAQRGTSWAQRPFAHRFDDSARAPDRAVPVVQASTKQPSPAQRTAYDSSNNGEMSPRRASAETSILSSDPGLARRPAQASPPRSGELQAVEPAARTANPAEALPVVRTDDRIRSGILVPQHVVPGPSTRQAPAHDHAREIPAQAATPDIHISIGRVEVRALTTVARSSPGVHDANARRSTRLDEYLGRRERAR